MATKSRLVSALQATPSQNAARTANGALTNRSSLSAVVDLFFVAGASRGKDITSMFAKAYGSDSDLTARLSLWLRDAREGAGERELFRQVFGWLVRNDLATAKAVLARVPELGRWDDVLIALDTPLENEAINLIREGLNAKNGLCAKWMPRQGLVAVKLRNALGLSPKQYRKLLVSLSNTVEQAMCAQNWSGINYDHVPSVAFNRYKKAFEKHNPQLFKTFLGEVQKGEKKINAAAIFPHDIVGSLRHGSVLGKQAADLQWKSLPNYLEGNDENIMVVADVSGSMTGYFPSMKFGPIDVCISLAMYMSERINGYFKDTFITFSDNPKLQVLSGSLQDRVRQLERAEWGMSTNLQAVFKLILSTARSKSLRSDELPSKIIIVSDMEFNSCVRDATNFSAIEKQYADAGYKLPQIIFWNVNGRQGNNPVTKHQSGAALVSGFSPAIVKSVLGQKSVTPEDVMLQTLLKERYDY
jgi:hypothetical protein